MRMHGANTIYCTVDGWVYHYRRQPIRDAAASKETGTNVILPTENPTVVWEGHCLGLVSETPADKKDAASLGKP